MDIPQALDFLRANHRAVLATTRSDGSPQLSPVGVSVDDDGLLVVSTRETAVKTRNLRRDPRAAPRAARRAGARVVVCAGRCRLVPRAWWGGPPGGGKFVSLPDAMEGL